jgi:hypothetical protein
MRAPVGTARSVATILSGAEVRVAIEVSTRYLRRPPNGPGLRCEPSRVYHYPCGLTNQKGRPYNNMDRMAGSRPKVPHAAPPQEGRRS